MRSSLASLAWAFTSGFIVADKITVESRRAGLPETEGVRWTSSGTGDFEVETITRPQRGTSVILHLRDDQLEFLNAWKLKSLVSKYSDHISLPILMEKEEWKDSDKEGEPGAMVKTGEWETVNKASALWTRAKKTSPPSSTKSSTKASATTTKTRWPGRTTAWKATASTRSCSTSRPRPRLTCTPATSTRASSCTSSACSSWTMPKRSCRSTCALSRA